MNHEGPHRLDAVPSNIPSDKPEARTSGSGSICKQANSSTAGIRQLETRPFGHSHRHNYNDLDKIQSICQSSMEPGQRGTGTTTSRPCPSGSGVESSGMVLTTTRDVSGHTTSDPPKSGSDHSHTPKEPPKGYTPTSHEGYLRKHYKD